MITKTKNQSPETPTKNKIRLNKMIGHSTTNSRAPCNSSIETVEMARADIICSPSVESVSCLTNNGISNLEIGNHDMAEACFSQALSEMNVNLESVRTLLKFKGILQEDVELSSSSNKSSVACDIQRRQELDEGMNIYTEPLLVNQSTSLDFAASTLFYNIAQTYSRRAKHEVASLWFKQSLTRLQVSGCSRSILAVKILHNLGYSYYCLGKNSVSLNYFENASSLILELGWGGTNHMAASLNCIGVLHFHNEPTDKNYLEMLQRSLSIYRSNPVDGNSTAIATVLNNIARVYFFQAKYNEALHIYDEALGMRLEFLGPESLDVAATIYNLGQTYQKLGDLEKSIECYNEFLKIAKSGSYTRYMALALKGIAEVHYERGELKDSFNFFTKALDLQRLVEGKFNREVCFTLNRLGNVCFALERYDAALKYYKEGLEVEKALYSSEHPYIIITMCNIAHIYKTRMQHSRALAMYSRVYQMQVESLGPNNIKVADTLSSMGLMHLNNTNFEAAFECYQESLRIRRENFNNDDHPDIASTLNSLGLALFKQDMFEMAKQCFNESLRIRRKILGRDHRDVAILWYNLATIFFETGEHDTSIEFYREALRIERMTLGADHPDVVTSLEHLGQVSQQAGQLEESLKYFHEALEIEKSRDVQKSRTLMKILNLIGNVYLQQGNTNMMMKYFIEASRIYESSKDSSQDALVISGYNFYGLSKMHPPCAQVA